MEKVGETVGKWEVTERILRKLPGLVGRDKLRISLEFQSVTGDTNWSVTKEGEAPRGYNVTNDNARISELSHSRLNSIPP